MPTLKTYFKSEDAQLAASLLRSEGIDAVVFDESGYGGNILGATSNSIRIEVPEDQLEEAQKLLIASAEPSDDFEFDEDALKESELASKLPPESKTQAAFRSLVVVEVVLMALGMVLDPYLYQNAPDYFPDWNAMPSALANLILFIYDTWWASLILSLLASILLFFYINVGRYLYLGTVIWTLLSFIAYPSFTMTAAGAILSGIHWMISGCIIGMMFVPEVAQRFRTHVGDR